MQLSDGRDIIEAKDKTMIKNLNGKKRHSEEIMDGINKQKGKDEKSDNVKLEGISNGPKTQMNNGLRKLQTNTLNI